MRQILYFISLIFLINCSHISNKNISEKPPIVEIDGANLVSTQVAFDLAFSCFVKGCVDTHHSYGKKGIHKDCVKQARAYIDHLLVIFKFKKPVKSKK